MNIFIFVFLIIVLIIFFLVNLNLRKEIKKNIDEFKDMERDLESAKKKAELSSQSKSEFLANMSHEIRTPMNSVLGFTQLLERTNLEDTQKSYVDSIRTSGKNLLSLINDILDLSKIEAGKLSIDTKPFNLNTLLQEVQQVFNLALKSKRLEFMIDYSSDVPKLIYSDEVRIRQILLNLVGNAVKFTKKGFVNILVDIVYIDTTYLTLNIYVVDSGMGIAKENQEKIFQNFEQQKNQSSSFGGTGLGLAICNKLAKKLGGEISLTSKENKGSTFTLRIENLRYSNENILQKNSIKDYTFKDSTILLVDEHKENRELIKGILQDKNITIIEAHDTNIAIEYLDKIKIDLILLDLRSPLDDGYKIITRIRKNIKYKHTPILCTTASVYSKNKVRENHGFEKIIYKPLIYEDFMDSLAEYLDSDVVSEKIIEINELKELIIDDDIKRIYIDEFYETIIKQEKKNNFKELRELSLSIMHFAQKYELKDLSVALDNLDKSIKLFDIEKIKEILQKLKNIAQ